MPLKSDRPKLYLVDGSGFIFRAFHALPPLKRGDGVQVGAVYGFCNMLTRLQEKIDHNKILVVFDAGRQTFRQQIYPEYKAHRAEIPAELIPQFSIIREACQALAIPTVEQIGYEADDLIASYAEIAKHQGYQVIIVSSDKDLMQLVEEQVVMLDPIKNKVIDSEEVFLKFGVQPDKVIDVQALAGDASDNIPGVPSIGIKTAAELINQFGNLETLLNNIHTIKQPKRRQVFSENIDKARISLQLVTLVRDIPLPLPINDLSPQKADPVKRTEFLKKQGFNSLLARLVQKNNEPKDEELIPTLPAEKSSVTYTTINTIEDLNRWIQSCYTVGIMAIDTETTSLNIAQANLVGISLAIPKQENNQACYIPLTHQTDQIQLPFDDVISVLKPLLLDKSVLKIGHNLKYDLLILQKYGLDITPWADTMLMSYCLNAGKHNHGMDELALRYLNYQTVKFEDVVGSGKNKKTFDQVPVDQATNYAAEDADITLRLYDIFKKCLQQERKQTLYERTERPLVAVIAKMESTGIKVDSVILEELNKDFTERLVVLEKNIYLLAGREFNIASPKQLGEILFDEWSLPGAKKTKTGAYVTDVDVLEKLALQGHDLPARVLEWRSLAKLKSTYIDGLTEAINLITKRVHTSFSMAGTATGRLASFDPNLQNIPIRTEDGRKIRRAFVAEKGCQLVSLDYSQIELRLLAHFAKVEPLIDAFKHNQDIHRLTASQIFGIPLDDITNDQRRQAKAINFGIIYGISPFGLAQQIGVTSSEARHIIGTYFDRYPGIQAYMEHHKIMARENGYVETLWGRRCYTPTIRDSNNIARQFAERQAINAPLQGSNADFIKRAMIKIHCFLKEQQANTKMVLQVHDELLFEASQTEVETIIPSIKQIMEKVAILSVPLVVEVGMGKNWDEAH